MLCVSEKLSSKPLDFLLLLCLLFWIPMENTFIGRGYIHLLDLHASDTVGATLPRDILLICAQSLLLATIVAPILVMICSTSRSYRPGAVTLFRAGLIAWILGATISTMAHVGTADVDFDYAAGILSGALVYYAARRVRFRALRDYELAFRAIALGALLPSIYDLYRYHAAWGFPSLMQIITIKYDPHYWALNCFFGNPDNASCAYGIFSMICMPVAFGKQFGFATRVIAWLTLITASLNTLLTMSRTGILALFLAMLVTATFERSRRLLFSIVIASVMAVGTTIVGGHLTHLLEYFKVAATYDMGNANVESRIESMREGWTAFEREPIAGLGPGQSKRVIDETVPHEMIIWQAAECGVFAAIGVLLMAGGCLWELASVTISGARSMQSRLEFLYLLAPAVYFGRGLVSDLTINNSFVNTWICLVMAALGIVETTRAGVVAWSDGLDGGEGATAGSQRRTPARALH